MNLLRKFWEDERGEAAALSTLLIGSIVVIGSIVGLVTFRDQVVQELGDLAVALESLDQSYTSSIGAYVDDPPLVGNIAGSPPACLGLRSP